MMKIKNENDDDTIILYWKKNVFEWNTVVECNWNRVFYIGKVTDYFIIYLFIA